VLRLPEISRARSRSSLFFNNRDPKLRTGLAVDVNDRDAIGVSLIVSR
jgi:hypothetical protein